MANLADFTSTPSEDPKLFKDIHEWIKENETQSDLSSSTVVAKPSNAKIEVRTPNPTPSLAHSPSVPNPNHPADGTNWIGKLLEYRQRHRSSSGPDFTESSPPNSLLFTCTVSIGECPHPLPQEAPPLFTTKKAAKQHASKAAVTYLISQGLLGADGSIPKPAVVRPPPPMRKSSATPGGTTFAQQVPALCGRLGMSPPTYVIEQNELSREWCSGYAHFGGGERLGEFRDVFGKRNAKEVCAEKVVEYLNGVLEERLGVLKRDGAQGGEEEEG